MKVGDIRNDLKKLKSYLKEIKRYVENPKKRTNF